MADNLREVGIAFISEGERELLANIAKVDQAERSLEKTSRSLESAVKRQVASEKEAIRAYAALERAGMEYSQIQKALVQDAKMLDAANQRAVNSTLGVNRATKSARDSARAMSDALKQQEKAERAAVAELQRHERELEQLATKYKPLYAASKQYERALAEINRAHKLGVLGAKQHGLAVDQLQQEYQQFQNGTAGWENQFVQGGKRSARELNRMGMFTQQLGYQAGDFFVQWQSGTNVLVAFGQQATQLVGLLGVLNKNLIGVGAVLGIAIPIVTAIGAAWMRSSESMDEASDSAKDAESAIKSLDGALQDFIRTQRATEQGISLDELLSVETLEGAEKALDDANKKLKDFQDLVTSPGYGAGGGIDIVQLLGFGPDSTVDDAIAAVEAAEERLAAVRRKTSAERIKFVREERAELEANLRLQQIEIQYGSDSVQYMREQVEQERRILVEKMEQERVGKETQASLLEIFDATNRTRIANEAYTAGLDAVRNLWSEITDRIKDGTEELQKGYAAAVGPSQTLRRETEAYVTEMAEVFKQAKNLREELGDAAYEALRLADVDITSGVSAAAKAAAQLAANLGVSLSAAISIKNLQESKTYSGRGGGTEYYGQTDYTSDLNYVTIQEQIDKFNKALERSAGSTKKAKKEVSDLQKAMDEAYVSAEEFAEILQIDMIDATGDVADAWADFVASGFDDFKGFADSILDTFKKLIVDMIAIATRNRILIGLGLAPSGAIAGGGGVGAQVAGGGGGGLFGGFGSGISALLGTGGGGLAGLAGSGGILGGAGGIASGLSGVFSGGGLGSSFANLGGLISGSSGGLGALGAAIPAAGIVLGGLALLSKGLSRKYAGSGIRGEFGTEGFTGSSIDFYKGGFLRSNRTDYKPLDAGLETTLDQTITGTVDNLKEMADVLNLSTNSLADFNAEGFTIWTNGKTQEQIMEELESQILKTNEGMADLILTTDRFSKAGETSLETLTRLSSSLTAANNMFNLLGTTLYASSLRAGQMASDLVDLFGGAAQFTAATTAYWQSFYTEEERVAALTRILTEEFNELGISLPSSREGFKALVDSIDLTTSAGREMYASLIGLSSTLDQVLPQFGELRGILGDLVTDATSLISDQITAATEAQNAAENTARLWFRASDNIRDFVSDLLGTDLSGASRSQSFGASRSRYESALIATRGGDVEAAQSLPELAKTYLEIARSGARTELEFRRLASRVQGELNFAAGISELQGANQEVVVELYEQQIEVLGQLRDYLSAGLLTTDEINSMTGVIDSLQDAIENAEAFSYDDLVGSLDVAVSLSDDSPRWLRRLVQSADEGLRTTLDFIIRRDDLTPADRWIATTAVSEHIAAVDFVLRNDLDRETRTLALTTAADLNRNLMLNLTQDLDPETRAMVLTRNQNLTRRVNVVLAGDSDVTVRRLNRIQSLIGTEGDGRLTLDGGVSFDPDGVFSSLTASVESITDPMTELVDKLNQLTSAIDEQNQNFSTEQTILRKQIRGGNVIERAQSRGSDIVDRFNELRSQFGIGLVGQNESVSVGDRGYINSSFDYYSGGDVVGFKEALIRAFGTANIGEVFGQTNQMTRDAYQTARDLRQQIRDLGGVPAFANGGIHGGGIRLVGERGPELEVTGPSRIISNESTRRIFDVSGLMRELRSLRREVQVLRKNNDSANISLYRETRKGTKRLTEWATVPGSLQVTTTP
jgi:translation initiation factor 2B subunit (eIF-2B alpha/beta/delta family)